MPNPRTWTLPADLEAAVSATLREWSEEGKVERLWARDATLWTGADEASWLGWLGIADAQAGRVGELRRIAEDVTAGGLHARPAARDGRLEPLPRGPAHDLRRAPRLAGALRPGLDGPGPGPGGRGAGRSRADAVRRVLQVGHDPRAEHLQAVLLRAGEAGHRPRPGGRSVHRDHGSRLEARAGRPGGRLPSRVLRAAVDRRALLGPVRLRHGSGGPHGPRRRAAARRGPGDGARLRGPAARRGESRRRAGRRPGRARAAGGATRSRWSRPRGSTISAPGSNSSWPSRPGRGARA